MAGLGLTGVRGTRPSAARRRCRASCRRGSGSGSDAAAGDPRASAPAETGTSALGTATETCNVTNVQCKSLLKILSAVSFSDRAFDGGTCFDRESPNAPNVASCSNVTFDATLDRRGSTGASHTLLLLRIFSRRGTCTVTEI